MLRLAVMFRRSGHRQISQALETGMAGEIRKAMDDLRAARAKMVADMVAEIGGVKSEVETTRADGIAAMKLPRAELDGYRQEIREIHAEFATATNGGPPGPLSGTGADSPKPSATSGASATTSATDPAQPPAQPQGEPGAETAAPALAEPAASWQGK